MIFPVKWYSMMEYIFVQKGDVFTFATESSKTSNSSFYLYKNILNN